MKSKSFKKLYKRFLKTNGSLTFIKTKDCNKLKMKSIIPFPFVDELDRLEQIKKFNAI